MSPTPQLPLDGLPAVAGTKGDDGEINEGARIDSGISGKMCDIQTTALCAHPTRDGIKLSTIRGQ